MMNQLYSKVFCACSLFSSKKHLLILMDAGRDNVPSENAQFIYREREVYGISYSIYVYPY